MSDNINNSLDTLQDSELDLVVGGSVVGDAINTTVGLVLGVLTGHAAVIRCAKPCVVIITPK